jgi:SPX domain protein involved in polyphosphate accumulation
VRFLGVKVHKKLNPGLFEEISTEKVQSTNPMNPSVSHSMGHTMMTPPPAARAESQRAYEELQSLKTKMRSHENQMDVFKSQISDFVKTFDQRFDRLSQAIARLEKAVHAQGRDTESKMHAFKEKMQAQSFEEAKVEGLIERQTIVIRNFENRLTSLQKIINEKELLLMKYLEALKQNQPKR